MAYAVNDDVLARAGRYAGVFQVAGKRPGLADLDKFLADTAAEIDSALRSRGYDPAQIAADVKAALKDVNAYGALARALPSVRSGDTGLDALLLEARTIWDLAMGDGKTVGSIAQGTFPAIAELEAGQGGGGGQTASAFWDVEPQYGTTPPFPAALLGASGDYNPFLAPTFARGQRL